MGYATTDVLTVFVVCQCAEGIPNGLEVKRSHFTVREVAFQLVKVVFLAFAHQLYDGKCVGEMVEHHYILIEDIEHVGSIVLLLCLVLDVDLLEVAHCVERGVTVETAVVRFLTSDGEIAQEQGHLDNCR